MSNTLTPSEAAQLAQTIEMFEVITQSQPHDYQSLEILKEAYSKLGREQDVINTSKRIARAYVELGQLSSAILEYETILQRVPDDPDVQAALQAIENRATDFVAEVAPAPPEPRAPAAVPAVAPVAPAVGSGAKARPAVKPAPAEVNDGREPMRKIFVDTKFISSGDFDLCWTTPDPHVAPPDVIEPFIQVLADKGVMPVDRSLKHLVDRARVGLIPLDRYDVDMDLARAFSADTCKRWCVLPFDRMSKSVLVATANPFNQQAARELAQTTTCRIIWYLAHPLDLTKNLRKAFR